MSHIRTGTAADLRLHLLELLLPHAGVAAVALAREAEAFVLGRNPEAQTDPAVEPRIGDAHADAEALLRGFELAPGHDYPRHIRHPEGGSTTVMDAAPLVEGDDEAAAIDAILAESLPLAARDVPPGESWAFVDHRPCADVSDPEPAPTPPPPAKGAVWTPERKEILRGHCADGLEEAEIAELMGLAGKNAVYANAYRFGYCPMWKEAREARRAANAPAPSPEPEEPAAEIKLVVTRKAAADGVELPPPPAEPASPHRNAAPPPVTIRPDVDDQVAATLAADKPRTFPVQTRTIAEVERRPTPPSREDRERLIADYVKTKGVATTIDFGPDQPAIDVLRDYFHVVVKSNDPGRPWLINGGRRTTKDLWAAANRELTSRHMKPIKRAK